jgi:hypothetical protein
MPPVLFRSGSFGDRALLSPTVTGMAGPHHRPSSSPVRCGLEDFFAWIGLEPPSSRSQLSKVSYNLGTSKTPDVGLLPPGLRYIPFGVLPGVTQKGAEGIAPW